MKDICCIGHITLDKIVTPDRTVYMNGGTSFYFAHGIAHLPNPSFKLVTSLAESEMQAVEDIRKLGLEVDVIPSKNTVYFENAYGHNMNNRKQRVLAKADPFRLEDLKDVEAKFIHLGSLLADDFSFETIKELSHRGVLSVDAQGFLRYVEGEKVYSCDWENKEEVLKYADILKVNEHEIESLTGYKDVRSASRQLRDWGAREILITLGSYGSVIFAENKFYEIPAYSPKEIVDATGCGDTYATGYLYMRSQGADYGEAGRFAAAMSAIKLEHTGPFDQTEAEIRALMATK